MDTRFRGYDSKNKTTLTLALSHQGRGDYSLALFRLPLPSVGEGWGEGVILKETLGLKDF